MGTCIMHTLLLRFQCVFASVAKLRKSGLVQLDWQLGEIFFTSITCLGLFSRLVLENFARWTENISNCYAYFHKSI